MASATLQPSILSLRCVVAALLWRPQRPQCARVRGLLGAVRSAMMELPLKSGEIGEIRKQMHDRMTPKKMKIKLEKIGDGDRSLTWKIQEPTHR